MTAVTGKTSTNWGPATINVILVKLCVLLNIVQSVAALTPSNG